MLTLHKLVRLGQGLILKKINGAFMNHYHSDWGQVQPNEWVLGEILMTSWRFVNVRLGKRKSAI